MIDISDEHLTKLFRDRGHYYSKLAVLLMEEMSELTKELCKVYRDMDMFCIHRTEEKEFFIGRGLDSYYNSIMPVNIDCISEEMAHVYICLAAIRKLMNITDDDIQFFIDAKEIDNTEEA